MALHNNLNIHQKKVIDDTTGIKLVISGPGTGKTTTITHFLAEIITKKQALPHEILGLTFTNKAAEEMKERVARIVGTRPNIATIHSFAAGLLRKHPPKGYTDGFKIIDDATQFILTSELIKKLGMEEHPSYIMEKLTLARNLRDKKMLEDLKLMDFFKLYFNSLLEKNSIDYDGLLSWCVSIFESNSDILKKFQMKYKYVLVDEFQDINPIQYDILKLLVKKKGNLLCVGDFDQSIYGFRGADVNIMLNLDKDFPKREIFYLEQNYRSTPNIINKANSLIKHNANRREKPLWTNRQQGADPTITEYPNDHLEAALIAEMIKKGINLGKKYSNHAILYRVHTLSRIFEEELTKLNIPYQVIGGTSYYNRPEIKNILAFFQLVENPENNEAFSKAVSTLAEIYNSSAISFLRKNQDTVMIDQAYLAKESFIRYIPEMIHEMASQRSLLGLYDVIIARTGYLEFLKGNKSKEGERRVENIEELRSVLMEQDKIGRSIEQFLGFTQEIQHAKEQEAVKLMTIHAAKGLEFDTVIIVGVEQGMLPHYSNEEDDLGIEEERRLLYVALTRAKNHVFLSYPKERAAKGKTIAVYPSPFLKELGHESSKIKKTLSLFIDKRKKDNSQEKRLKRNEISEGSKVFHSFFGKGHIVEIDDYEVGMTKVKIDFHDGKRILILEMAPLKLE